MDSSAREDKQEQAMTGTGKEAGRNEPLKSQIGRAHV